MHFFFHFWGEKRRVKRFFLVGAGPKRYAQLAFYDTPSSNQHHPHPYPQHSIMSEGELQRCRPLNQSTIAW